jgi:hypothetical protein
MSRAQEVMVVGIVAIVMSGCGGSAAEIRRAKHSVYDCPAKTVRDAIKSTLEGRTGGAIWQGRSYRSKSHRYTFQGRKRRGLEGGESSDVVVDYLVHFSLKLDGWKIRPLIRVYRSLATLVRLEPDDPDYPAWAEHRRDGLLLGIHRRLKKRCSVVAERRKLGAPRRSQ